MSDDADDGEFAYFLPRLDDADDFGSYAATSTSSLRTAHDVVDPTPHHADDRRTRHADTARHEEHEDVRRAATIDDASAYTSMYGLGHSWQPQPAPESMLPVTAPVHQLQQQQQQQAASQLQHAAVLRAVMQQRENARMQAHAHAQSQSHHHSYGVSGGASDLLSAFYAQQSTSPNYYTSSPAPAPVPSPSPIVASSGLFSADPSASVSAPSDVASSLNHQQMQFYQQLQLYQQQLLMQQQQQQATISASHYTKAPVVTYDDASAVVVDDRPMSDAPTPSAPTDRSRRRPLPHHAHTSVIPLHRPTVEEPRASVVPQTKTTLVSTGSVAPSAPHATGSTVLSSSSWGSGHPILASQSTVATTTRDGASHRSRGKQAPVSVVVASSKTEVWPKASTLVAAASAPAGAVAKTAKAPGADKSPSDRRGAGGGVKSVKHAASASKRSGPPVATIRHIESAEPVPLTASEMANLNAHHRKGAGASLEKVATPAVATASTTKRVREHRTKYLPGPPALPNENVFGFLSDDSDEEQDDSADTTKTRGKNTPPKDASQSESASVAAATPSEEDASEESSAEEATSDDETAETASAGEEEPEHTEEEDDDGDDDEDGEDEDILSMSFSSSSSGSDSDSSSHAPSPSPPSPSRSPSAPISPTTGLPVPSILRRPSLSPTATHSRRVSFHQPASKKLSASSPPSKDSQPLDATPTGKEAAIGSPSESVPPATAPSEQVESVHGVMRRRKKKAMKADAARQESHAEEADEDDEGDAEAETTATVQSVRTRTSGSSLGSLFLFLASLASSLVSRDVVSRSRSVWSHLFDHLSYACGVLVGLAWTIIDVHRQAAIVLTADHQLAFYFAFIYLFPFFVQHLVYWAPPWAASCAWYAFLMQALCMQGSPLVVSVCRVLLPLLFLTEGVSHHTLLLGLSGSERVVLAFATASFKTREYQRPIFLLALATQVILSLTVGHHTLTQWAMLIGSIVAVHQRDEPEVAAASTKGKSTTTSHQHDATTGHATDAATNATHALPPNAAAPTTGSDPSQTSTVERASSCSASLLTLDFASVPSFPN